jgi:predicted ribonuclease toxin of YeeF-YezG toxin-antitoxin module
LKDALQNNNYTKLSPEAQALHRRDFNANREKIIKEWEQITGQSWPTYNEPVYSKDGKILRNVGDKYDAHHIIESSYGGPNKWWNMHPASFPTQHQGGIHRSGGPARGIFE